MFESPETQWPSSGRVYVAAPENSWFPSTGILSTEVIFFVMVIAVVLVLHHWSRENELHHHHLSPVADGSVEAELADDVERRLMLSPLDRRRESLRRWKQRHRARKEERQMQKAVETVAWNAYDNEEERLKHVDMPRRMKQELAKERAYQAVEHERRRRMLDRRQRMLEGDRQWDRVRRLEDEERFGGHHYDHHLERELLIGERLVHSRIEPEFGHHHRMRTRDRYRPVITM